MLSESWVTARICCRYNLLLKFCYKMVCIYPRGQIELCSRAYPKDSTSDNQTLLQYCTETISLCLMLRSLECHSPTPWGKRPFNQTHPGWSRCPSGLFPFNCIWSISFQTVLSLLLLSIYLFVPYTYHPVWKKVPLGLLLIHSSPHLNPCPLLLDSYTLGKRLCSDPIYSPSWFYTLL